MEPKTLHVTIHGIPASWTQADGWRCNDGLAEKFLRSLDGTDDTPTSEEQALALAVREYGAGNVTRYEPKAPVIDEDAEKAAADAAHVAEAEAALTKPSAINDRIRSFSRSRGTSADDSSSIVGTSTDAAPVMKSTTSE